MVQPAIMAGGAFVLILLVVVVWGYFFAKPKFWGLFSKIGDECEPDEDDKIENADKYQLDKDKKCVLVKTCATGYSPNSSNTACVSSGGSDDTDATTAAEKAAAERAAAVPIELLDANMETFEPINFSSKWEEYNDDNKVDDALQYAKIGVNWVVSLCQYNKVPYNNPTVATKADRPKLCGWTGTNPDDVCPKSTDPNTSSVGLKSTGRCGATSCNDGYVIYENKCVDEDSNPPKIWKEIDGASGFVKSIGGQPSYMKIPPAIFQQDRTCRQMCNGKLNVKMKDGKRLKTIMPSNWKGSIISSSTPTHRFWNHSIDEIAINTGLWDSAIQGIFKDFLVTKKPSSGNSYLIGTDSNKHGVIQYPSNLAAARILVGEYKPKSGEDYFGSSMNDEDIQSWKDYLTSELSCQCAATDDARYHFA